jgi:cysteinyl-tRNA synthetase
MGMLDYLQSLGIDCSSSCEISLPAGTPALLLVNPTKVECGIAEQGEDFLILLHTHKGESKLSIDVMPHASLRILQVMLAEAECRMEVRQQRGSSCEIISVIVAGGKLSYEADLNGSFASNLLRAAYVVGNDVFFRVNSVENYGQLANISLDELKSGARIESNNNKENPFDFTLWKKTEKGITWDSPWGHGRPGWHTECCVMINNIFGNTIDIHGGGFDLKFPHHTNEIAQNHATCGKNLANYWMHNGFVVINNEKMSKSLGNVIKGNEFIDRIGPLLTRYILLATYYRAPLNISDDIIETSRIELNKITSLLNNLYRQIQLKHIEIDETKILSIDTFVDALCDDLNISNAMAEIFRIVKEANQSLRQREIDPEIIVKYFNTLNKMLDILGLKVDLIKLSEEDINLINEFNKARAEKDFAKSDIIRAELIKKGLM